MFWRRITVDKRCRFEYANFVLISSSDFSRVCATVQCWYPNVIMGGTRYYLYAFESTGQDNDIATSRICLIENRNNVLLINNNIILFSGFKAIRRVFSNKLYLLNCKIYDHSSRKCRSDNSCDSLINQIKNLLTIN